MSAKYNEPVIVAELVDNRPARSPLFPILLVLGIVGAIGAFLLATGALVAVVGLLTARPQTIDPPTTEGAVTGIVNVTDATFAAEVMSADLPGPILVDFHADWCGPCRTQGQILQRYAAKHSDVKIAKVDVDQNLRLASEYDVRSIPTLLVVKGGQVTARHTGVARERDLAALLRQ